MHLSCKITNAILTYLEAEKIDLSGVFSEIDVPWEQMRDSSNWLKAPDMEALLERIIQNEEWIVKAGHNTPKNKAWGVLDSVLRMMPRPQEIFQQPEKFIGYFISPEPPLENVVRSENGISFDIPLPAEQYPLVSKYLMSAFEALPLYVGLNPGSCQWQFMHFKLDWPVEQKSILLQEEHHQVSPQLMQDVIRQLQQSSRALEEKNRELQRRNEELLKLAQEHSLDKKEPAIVSQQYFSELQNMSDSEFLKRPVHQVAQNLSRLHDYMVRAHQLVTLLTAGQKQTPGIKEAFRRVDWDIVKDQYPQIILESIETLKKINRKD